MNKQEQAENKLREAAEDFTKEYSENYQPEVCNNVFDFAKSEAVKEYSQSLMPVADVEKLTKSITGILEFQGFFSREENAKRITDLFKPHLQTAQENNNHEFLDWMETNYKSRYEDMIEDFKQSKQNPSPTKN